MIETLFGNLAIFILSLLVGVEVISKIPSTLHTPMMSAANAIHGWSSRAQSSSRPWRTVRLPMC